MNLRFIRTGARVFTSSRVTTSWNVMCRIALNFNFIAAPSPLFFFLSLFNNNLWILIKLSSHEFWKFNHIYLLFYTINFMSEVPRVKFRSARYECLDEATPIACEFVHHVSQKVTYTRIRWGLRYSYIEESMS